MVSFILGYCSDFEIISANLQRLVVTIVHVQCRHDQEIDTHSNTVSYSLGDGSGSVDNILTTPILLSNFMHGRNT